MTEDERRLRARVDTLLNERAQLRQTVASFVNRGPRPSFRECAYCGVPTYGKACREHRDLIQLDASMGGTG
jgi:hypothetical protein